MLTDRSRTLLARVNYNGLKLDDDGKLPAWASWATINTLELKLLIGRDGDAWTITKAGRIALMEHVPRLLHRDSSRGYTDKPALAVAGEPEAVDQTTLEGYAEENRIRHLARQASLEQRVAEAFALAKQHGINIAHQEAAIAKRVSVIERKVLQARTQAA